MTKKDEKSKDEEDWVGPELKLRKVYICHRIPERTFKIGNHYFPVCSRCTGFYMAAFSYFVFVYFFYVHYSILMILTAFLMLIPAFLDGTTQFLGWRTSNNILRFTTGLVGGLGLGILVKAFKWFLMS